MDDMLKRHEITSEEAKNTLKGIAGMFILMKATGGLENVDDIVTNLINKLPTATEYACDAIDLMDRQLSIEEKEG